MSTVTGGQAGFRSVMFHNSTAIVKASRNKKGNIDVKVTPISKKNATKLGLMLYRIPFVRGVWQVIEQFFLLGGKRFAAALGILVVASLTLQFMDSDSAAVGNHRSGFFYLFFSVPYHYFFLFGVFLCAALFIKLTELGKYHSAEHMVDNAYRDSKNLSLHNVQTYSRIHEYCGTNRITFVLIFYCVFFYLFGNVLFATILAFSFSYEVFRIDDGWMKKALMPVYAFSYFMQWLLFTSKPDPEHIEVSIAAYRELIKHSSNV